MATKVAVLDDYHGLAPSYFGKLDPSVFTVKYFPETLRPYNNATTSEEERQELIKRLEPFDVISTLRERTPFPRELIEQLPRLKLILSCGRRNKAIDMEACQSRGIPVTATIDNHVGLVDSTTEHIVTLTLAACRSIPYHDTAIKTGKWQTRLVTSISGKTLGLVGLGRLGGAVARIMSLAFGTKIIAWSTNLTQEVADKQAKAQGLPVHNQDGEKTFKAVSREELFSTADVVSVQLVLSDRTRGLITESDLSRMKPSSFFINTSRGPLVVEKDLFSVLEAGKIRGAALDVFDLEPLPLDSKWRNSDWGTNGKSQLVVTPHIAFVEERAMNEFYEQQVAELLRWSSGQTLSKTMY
ncbi:hypothetical protein V2G26_010629 [Clonostachys chloroleuca]